MDTKKQAIWNDSDIEMILDMVAPPNALDWEDCVYRVISISQYDPYETYPLKYADVQHEYFSDFRAAHTAYLKALLPQLFESRLIEYVALQKRAKRGDLDYRTLFISNLRHPADIY